MLLCELFDSGNKMEERLRQAALEVITPYLAQGLPFVTMQQMITALRPHSGIDITRGLLMKILDPNKTKAVDKIEGDHIVLARTMLRLHKSNNSNQKITSTTWHRKSRRTR
jgi:hypothetical protein